jgi:hypothetical protein
MLSELLIYLCPLYIKTAKDYTPEGNAEKKYLISIQKRNLLLRRQISSNKNLNKEVSNERNG